jgi:putative transposase
MGIYGSIVPGARRLAEIPVLSKAARLRLQWFKFYETHGRNASLTCRHFGLARQTFYRWKRRYDAYGIKGLEDRSKHPRRVRRHTWSWELEQQVKQLREKYPRWGKDKLAVLLELKGRVSVSMVGRILKHLKTTGRLKEPVVRGISSRKRRRRVYAVRKPKDYVAKEPGDLVEIDVKDIRPLPGIVLKHFSARDVVSRWDVLEVHRRATATSAAMVLDSVEARMPFKVKVIQVDGGSEFKSYFELECQKRGIRLFVLPPKSPKLNGHVERAHRTHAEEFYEVSAIDWRVGELNKELQEWERTYNEIRPHQALGYLTPAEWLRRYQSEKQKENEPPGQNPNGPSPVWEQGNYTTETQDTS